MPFGQFDIVFIGVREGFVEERVQAQFASLFKLDAVKTRRIFAAKKVTLKTNVEAALADKYIARLAAIGVIADKLAVADEFRVSKTTPVVRYPAIYYRDNGEDSRESSSMHQPVDFAYGPETRRIPFVFDARPLDYAMLWLGNMLVCLLSAGLLWPWARSRAQRFFYRHTSLDTVEFGYRSQISKVLLIQLALVTAILCVSISALVWPFYALSGLSLLLVAMPLALHKLQEFQLRNAFYGEHGWRYDASIRSTYIAFLAWPLAVLISAGLIAPWALMQIQRYLVESRQCGQITFSFNTHWKHYLPLLPPVLFADCLTGVLFHFRSIIPPAIIALVLIMAWLLVAVRWRVLLNNLFWNSVRCSLGYFIANQDLRSYQKLWLRNSLCCLLSLGFYWPWAKIHRARYKASHLAFFANTRYAKWMRTHTNR